MSSLKYRTTSGWGELNLLTLDDVYPVGALYLSYVNTSPASLFGGTWTQLTDRFLVGAGSNYAVGETGGAAAVTLTTAQMPSHAHELIWNDGSQKVISLSGNDAASSGSQSTGYRIDYASGSVYKNATIAKAVGSGGAHENKPPYLAVYMWRRTA